MKKEHQITPSADYAVFGIIRQKSERLEFIKIVKGVTLMTEDIAESVSTKYKGVRLFSESLEVQFPDKSIDLLFYNEHAHVQVGMMQFVIDRKDDVEFVNDKKTYSIRKLNAMISERLSFSKQSHDVDIFLSQKIVFSGEVKGLDLIASINHMRDFQDKYGRLHIRIKSSTPKK